MPPAVLADSDDDGDGEDLIGEPEKATSVHPNPPNQSTAACSASHAGLPGLDGTNDHSTGSTDRLRNQIETAERGLCSYPATAASESQPTFMSPPDRASKRRHTSALTLDSAINDDTAINACKRIKRTGATSGTRHRSSSQSLVTGGPVSSASAGSSEHPAGHSSTGISVGLIDQDFLNHEPAVMFQDSGSTVENTVSVDRESLHLMVYGDRQTQLPVARDAASPGHRDSSFSWSASDKTSAAQRDLGGRLASSDQAIRHGNDFNLMPADLCVNPIDTIKEAPEPWHSQPDGTMAEAECVGGVQQRASPIVEILRDPLDRAAFQCVESYVSPRRGRKPAPASATDHPASHDAELMAMGLPPEMYKPRPSRRRATQMEDNDIDSVVRPEKAAKIKRNKSMQADARYGGDTRPPASGAVTGEASAGCTGSEADLKAAAASNSMDIPRASSAIGDGIVQVTEPTKSVPSPSRGDGSDDRFVKPVKPKAKPKPTKKSRRSQTTIFEDHVDLPESQRSLSLSQQQATRKSALRVIYDKGSHRSSQDPTLNGLDSNETTVSNTVCDNAALRSDDSHASNELPASKKRPRGRPRKQPKPPSPVMEDQATNGHSNEDCDEAQDSEEASPARGQTPLAESITSHAAPAHSTLSPAKGAEVQGHDDEPTVVNSNAESGSASPHDIAAGTPKATKTAHSPIKSSSQVPLRVGLNKRQRIPSLLRVINPLRTQR